jgi:hypothetical protein
VEEPKLKQFGLTEQQVEYLEKGKEKDFKATMIFCVIFGALATVYFFYIEPIFPASPSRETIRPISWVLVYLLSGALGGAFLGAIVSAIYGKIRDKFSTYYRRLSQYEAAKQKYEFWWVRNQQLFWTSLGGKRFEYELAYLYHELGYEVKLPKRGQPDKGVDFSVFKDGKKIIVQCKAHQKPVGPHVIRDLYGTLASSKADEAILASISGFTSGVREYALGKPIYLVSLEDIIRMRKQIPSE